MGDQLVAEAATCTTHNKHKRRTSMPSAGFEPAIDWSQTCALDLTATGIGFRYCSESFSRTATKENTVVQTCDCVGRSRNRFEGACLVGCYCESTGE